MGQACERIIEQDGKTLLQSRECRVRSTPCPHCAGWRGKFPAGPRPPVGQVEAVGALAFHQRRAVLLEVVTGLLAASLFGVLRSLLLALPQSLVVSAGMGHG